MVTEGIAITHHTSKIKRTESSLSRVSKPGISRCKSAVRQVLCIVLMYLLLSGSAWGVIVKISHLFEL